MDWQSKASVIPTHDIRPSPHNCLLRLVTFRKSASTQWQWIHNESFGRSSRHLDSRYDRCLKQLLPPDFCYLPTCRSYNLPSTALLASPPREIDVWSLGNSNRNPDFPDGFCHQIRDLKYTVPPFWVFPGWHYAHCDRPRHLEPMAVCVCHLV